MADNTPTSTVKVSDTPKVDDINQFIVLGVDKNTNLSAHADMAQLSTLNNSLTGFEEEQVPTRVTAESKVLQAFEQLQSQLRQLGYGLQLKALEEVAGASTFTGAGVQFGDNQLRLIGQRYRIGTNAELVESDGSGKTVAPWLSPSRVFTNPPASGSSIMSNTTYRLSVTSDTEVILRSTTWQSGERTIIRTTGAVNITFAPSGVTARYAKDYANHTPATDEIMIYLIVYTGGEFIISRRAYV